MLPPIRMIAIDLDGTLLSSEARVSPRNLAALLAAQAAGIHLVIATGRRHCYAMRVLRGLGLHERNTLISSNGAVTRTFDHHLLDRSHLPTNTVLWLCEHIRDYRNALVVTFDRVGPNGEDAHGALVVEHLEELHASIGKWMAVNEPYIAHVNPIEQSLQADTPIQMMLCGTLARMRRAEALLLDHEGVAAVGITPRERIHTAEVALHRTEYPERDLCIVDILPAGCSKGAALLRLASAQSIAPGEILAIGDNWNDVSMLEVAGSALIMANAPADLKGMASQRGWQIGLDHNHDGVAVALEDLLQTHEPATAEC